MFNIKELNRRNFLKTIGFFTALASFKLSASSLESVNFIHGVASGDPTEDKIILWSRVTSNNKSNVQVTYEISSDKEFRNLILKGQKSIGAKSDFTIKVDATIPREYRGAEIFYRFRSGNSISDIGRTSTLPKSKKSFKVAIFSCSNFPSGYFNAYEAASNEKSIDLGIHVGDYIYEYKLGEYATENATALGREPLPNKEIISLKDYRLRHAQYKSDKDLQRLHASMPIICAWDDHEISNDTWSNGAENHQADEGSFYYRKRNALKAYFEWMPVREPKKMENNWKQYKVGNLLDIKLLETRLSSRTQQINLLNFIRPNGSFDREGFLKSLNSKKREMLGPKQLNFIKHNTESDGSWNLYAQQVLLASLKLPPIPNEIIDNLPEYQDYFKLIIAEDLPYNFDAWDGYPTERKEFLNIVGGKSNKNLFVAGDTHNCWVNNIEFNRKFYGVELGAPSVTSPGAAENFSGLIPPENLEQGIIAKNPNLKWTNLSNRGYVTIDFKEGSADVEFKGIDNISSKTYKSKILKKFTILPGEKII